MKADVKLKKQWCPNCGEDFNFKFKPSCSNCGIEFVEHYL